MVEGRRRRRRKGRRWTHSKARWICPQCRGGSRAEIRSQGLCSWAHVLRVHLEAVALRVWLLQLTGSQSASSMERGWSQALYLKQGVGSGFLSERLEKAVHFSIVMAHMGLCPYSDCRAGQRLQSPDLQCHHWTEPRATRIRPGSDCCPENNRRMEYKERELLLFFFLTFIVSLNFITSVIISAYICWEKEKLTFSEHPQWSRTRQDLF